MSRLSRRETLGFGVGAGVSVTMLAAGQGEAEAAAATPSFTLLLVNDIYKAGDVKGRGGFAKLAAVVKAERARGVPVLFCHAGDSFSPSLISGFDQGEHIVRLTNMIGPDVFVPGNHEFDFGVEVFARRRAEARYPFLAANLRQSDGTPVPGIEDRLMVTLGPLKVGVFGVALAATPEVSQAGSLAFGPEIDTVRREAAALRSEGADFVVCVAHTARATDIEIVRSRLVDVLLTGHDHDLAIGYDGSAAMVESNEEGNFVTAIDIFASVSGEGDKRRVSWTPSFRVHDTTTVEPDPAVQAVVASLEADLSKELDVVIATTTVEIDSRTASVRSRETVMGDIVADALRASTGADCAITNGGGLRANRLYAPGTALTRRDVLSELPFGNTIVLVAITGADIRAALENGLGAIGEHGGRFPQVSGLAFTYDPAAPKGSRLLTVTVGGKPLEDARRYTVASNNFMLAGGDGYDALARGKVLIGATDGKLMANVVMAYLRDLKTVREGPDGRIASR
jgi:5'-nucleotidase / UDP-sugar diphosphatase